MGIFSLELVWGIPSELAESLVVNQFDRTQLSHELLGIRRIEPHYTKGAESKYPEENLSRSQNTKS